MFDWDFNAPVSTYNLPISSHKFVCYKIKKHDHFLHVLHSFQVKPKCNPNNRLCIEGVTVYEMKHIRHTKSKDLRLVAS